MRVEWAKSRARRDRWTEEAELVQEEMRRALAYLQWRSQWWIAQAELRNSKDISPSLLNGLRAYAKRQAQLQLDLGVHFARMWYLLIKRRSLACTWPVYFIQAASELQRTDIRAETTAHAFSSASTPASIITSPPPISSAVHASERPDVDEEAAERLAKLAIGPSSEVFGAHIDIGSGSEGSSDGNEEKLDWGELADV